MIGVIGPIQVDILRCLHDASNGVPVSDLLKEYRYKQGGKRSLASLEKAGYIRTTKGVVHFVRFPDEIEQRVTIKTYSTDQLRELDDLSRRNLLYLYQDELAKYKDSVVPANAIPHGARRSLQHLGVIKWKILELTDFGRKLLGEIMSRTTPPMRQTSIGY
jgi:DNA-binding MarR family transcriptional regulator